MLSTDTVEQLIRRAVNAQYVAVQGDGHHFFADIVCADFAGKNRLARHRMVKDGLKNELASNELHALSITAAATPDEWAQRQA